MAVAPILHQGGKLMQLNGSFPLVLMSHEVRHPRHVVPYILAHGDFYRLAPPVTGPVNVYGAYPAAGAGQPAEYQQTPDQVPHRRPHRGGRSGAGSPRRAAGARLPPSLPPCPPPAGAVRGGERRESLQRPHVSCQGQHRPRCWGESRAAGAAGAGLSIARAALLRSALAPPGALGGGCASSAANGRRKRKYPLAADAHNLLRGARQLFFSPGFHFCDPSFHHRPSSCSSSFPRLPPRSTGRAVPGGLGSVKIRAITSSTCTCPRRLFGAAAFSRDSLLPKPGRSSVLSYREVEIGLSECRIKEEEEEISKLLKRGVGSNLCPAPLLAPLCSGCAGDVLCALCGAGLARVHGGCARCAPPASADTPGAARSSWGF